MTSFLEWDWSLRAWICRCHGLRSSGGLTIGQKNQVGPISASGSSLSSGGVFCIVRLYYWVWQEGHFNLGQSSNSHFFTTPVFTTLLFYLPLQGIEMGRLGPDLCYFLVPFWGVLIIHGLCYYLIYWRCKKVCVPYWKSYRLITIINEIILKNYLVSCLVVGA